MREELDEAFEGARQCLNTRENIARKPWISEQTLQLIHEKHKAEANCDPALRDKKKEVQRRKSQIRNRKKEGRKKKRKDDSLTYNFNSSKNDISNGSNSNNNLENQVEDRSDFNDFINSDLSIFFETFFYN